MSLTRHIVLVGARLDGQAGVVLGIVRQNDLYDVVGFIDDDPNLVGKRLSGVPVLGGLDAFVAEPRHDVDGVFLCIGDNRARERCYDTLVSRGIQVVNVIHPNALIGPDVRIGNGVFVGPNATVMNNVHLGNGVTINTAATVDHDNRIDDFANISPGCHTSGRVHIKTRAFLGTGTVTIPDVTIGRDAYIGAGSVVINDIPDRARVAGVPALPIRK